jgi:phage antirepressor YoqD-like protein
MQDLISGKVLTMSSLDIAKLTGKNHSDVKRDIMNTLSQADLDPSKFAHVYSDANNRTYPCYLLPKRECDLVVSGYSVKYRLAIIDRWQELENKQPENPLLQLANAVLTAQKVIDDQSNRLAIAEPKAIAFDLISEAEGELCLTDAAKHLQIKPSLFIKWLQINGWIFRRTGSKSWAAYQNRIDQGFMIHKRATFTRTSGADDYSWQALITPKGISAMAKNKSIQEFLA